MPNLAQTTPTVLFTRDWEKEQQLELRALFSDLAVLGDPDFDIFTYSREMVQAIRCKHAHAALHAGDAKRLAREATFVRDKYPCPIAHCPLEFETRLDLARHLKRTTKRRRENDENEDPSPKAARTKDV